MIHNLGQRWEKWEGDGGERVIEEGVGGEVYGGDT